jgi:uncharacterized protein (TIGR02231 family)
MPSRHRLLNTAWTAFFLTSLNATAFADVIDVKTAVSKARLYPHGATVTRMAHVAAPVGRHEYKIDDLPLRIDPATLRAKLHGGDATTLIGTRYRHPQAILPNADSPERQVLEEHIRDVTWALRAAQDAADASQQRVKHVAQFRDALLKTGSVTGGAGLMSKIDHWPAVWSRLSDEMAAAQSDSRAAQRQIESLETRLRDLNDQLSNLTPSASRGALFITFRAEEAIKDAILEVSYLTDDANWRPVYDLRLLSAQTDKGASRLSLVRRAAVRQTTGEDWRDVSLVLSTARPSGRMEALKPHPLQAQFAPAYDKDPIASQISSQISSKGDREPGQVQQAPPIGQEAAAPAPKPVRPRASAQAAAMRDFEGAAVSFEAPYPADLSGDGEITQIFLSETVLQTEQVARATPARDETAFLYAVYKNDNTPILPGQASIFRNDTFVGRVGLKAVQPGDEAALPFGPIDAIKVARQIKDRSKGEEGFFRSENHQIVHYTLTAENLGTETRRVTLFDSAPFSEDAAIKIAVKPQPKATHESFDGDRGVYAWTFDLAPGEGKEIALKYEITWPDDREIIITSGRSGRFENDNLPSGHR